MTDAKPNEYETILNLMARPLETLNMPQSRICGLFVFIDHLMCKHQKSSSQQDKQLKVIDTLLQSGPKMHVAIHHPKKEDLGAFLQKMLSNADQIENNPSTHQPIIQKCAERFKEAFKAFFSLIKNKLSTQVSSSMKDLWSLLDCHQDIRNFTRSFVNSLVNFSYLYYQETIGRLLKLNNNQVEGRLHHAQHLCAKAII